MHLSRPLAPVPADPTTDVTVLRWPAQDHLRLELALGERLRLLLVAADAAPPELIDEREDWLREPAAPDDLVARSRALRRRQDELRGPAPSIDPDGLLRHDGRWTAIPEAQLDVVRLLVDRVDRLVATDQIASAYEAGGGSAHPNALRTLVARLRGRFAELGLDLVTVRGRGLVLATTPCAEAPRSPSSAQGRRAG